MFEMERWLEVRKEFNGASWYRAEHKMVILTDASDASSSGWGGLIHGLHHDVFRAGGDFPPALVEEHINAQEGYVLQQTLRLFCADHPVDVAGATLVSDVDNKVLHDAFKRGRARNTLTHDTIIALFSLQVRHDFTLKLRWVSSAANADADDMSRPGSDDYVRLDERMFGELCEWAGDFDMDLMATPASVHKTWVGGHCTGAHLPFYSRYRTQGCAGVDVLSQNVKRMPTSQRECFGFCFPPTKMVGVLLQHLDECGARAVVVLPDQKQSWFPRLAGATVQSKRLSAPGGPSPFFRVHHRRGSERFHFQKWGMLAVEVNFAAA